LRWQTAFRRLFVILACDNLATKQQPLSMNFNAAKTMTSSNKHGSTFDAGFWVLVSQGGTQFLRLFTSIFLTRLLSPDAFGLIAIAMTFVTAIHMVSDLGLRQIIVTSEHSTSPLFLDTVWSLQIIRGVLILVVALVGALGLSFLANWLGHSNFGVYSDPALPAVFAMLGLSAVILGFESTGIGVAVRDTNLGRMVVIDILVQLISAAMTLLLAYYFRSVWPLVAGNLVGASARVLLSRKLFVDHVNSFRLDKEYMKEILNFSKWIFTSSAMGFVVNNADKLAFSLVMSATQFGTVAIAISLLGVLLDTINRLVDNVAFPKFRQAVQKNNSIALAETFFRFRFWLESVVFFLIAFLWFASDSIVQLLFDSRYQSAAQYLRILSLTQLWLIASCCSSLGLALGNTSLLAKTTWIRLVLTIFFPFVGYHFFGEMGVAWALVAAQMPAVLYAVFSARSLLGQKGINKRGMLAFLFVPLGGLVGYLVSIVLPLVRH
jgi:O-antigen/teichoic acid export membrane protein